MNSTRFFAGICLIAMTSTGCLTLRRNAKQTLRNREATELLSAIAERQNDWTTLGLRLEATASAMGNQGTFTLNVRMAKDSVVWMSISPALGVEAFPRGLYRHVA